MKTKSITVITVSFIVLFLAPLHGELSGDRVMQSYSEDRARGLIALNERYLAAFEKELNSALQAKKLEEANAIQAYIKTLKVEIEELKSGRAKGAAIAQNKMADESLLVGKTIGFPHPDDPKRTVFFSFQKGGKALWLWTKNAQNPIPREYKPSGKPRQFLLWWPGRGGNFQITVGAEGNTAELIELRTGRSVLGIIKETE